VSSGQIGTEGVALPVIDLVAIQREDANEIDRLRSALHEAGFLYLSGHGFAPELVDRMFGLARQFFALPLADRMAIENVHSPHFRGYTSVGNEYTQGHADQRDQIDLANEREALVLSDDDPKYLRMIGPNQWPAALPELRPVVLEWFVEAKRVTVALLRGVSLALGQPADFFDPWFDDFTHDHMKIIRYPGRQSREGDQGVGSHKDYGWIALLLQDDLGGLQVQTLDGEWLDAPPLPGTFVINIGEMLEIVSGGYMRATVHRVVSPDTTRDRISIPFFPGLDAVVPVVELPTGLAAQARGIEQDPANPMSSTYGENAIKGWLRAHPRVAERWWADVAN
jgi:isopenicillin N synthase-like dioxygenase